VTDRNDRAFIDNESAVRSYCRRFPVVLDRAEGCLVFDEEKRAYLDFFAGAGTLNYGHNPKRAIEAMTAYLQSGSILHSLDFHTRAKRAFLERFRAVILEPRGLDHVVQFTGPTGTNAIEAALKLARKVTGRRGVAAFTNAFHGMTAGSLSISATSRGWPYRSYDVTRLPYDGFVPGALGVAEKLLLGAGSGVEPPAAIVLEMVQGEGGLNVASRDWAQGIERIARKLGALLIVDDIQAGCGRTGTFFSFEGMGIEPDVICLSKSLSGSGMPLAVNLIARPRDIWEPGEHNGTFRGNNLAFVSAEAILDHWATPELAGNVAARASQLRAGLERLARVHADRGVRVVGRGLMIGLRGTAAGFGGALSAEAFRRGLIAEPCGPEGEVLKLLPPLVVSHGEVEAALSILDASLDALSAESPRERESHPRVRAEVRA